MHDVVVLGAGLSGLLTAWRLQQAGRDVVVLEARDRIGGRLARPEAEAVDLGASWVWDTERHVHALLRELGIATFPHHDDGIDLYDDGVALHRGRLPRSHVPERRIVGGAHGIAAALAARVDGIRPGVAARAVTILPDGLAVQTDGGALTARHVVAALPPALLVRSVDLPPLPEATRQALAHCPTWMADVAKVVVRYPDRPWRAAGLSGRAASRAGPLVEVHDLSGPGGADPALFGFVPRELAREGWRDRIVPQLVRLFGPGVAAPLAVHARAWWEERYTVAPDTPAGSPRLLGHPALRAPLLDGRLHLVSTETSGVSPGHMDGAVERAEAVAARLAG